MADEERAVPEPAGGRELRFHLERAVGGLALSELDGVGSMGLMRAVAWHNVLARLGMAVPLMVVHDVGCSIAGLGQPSSMSRGLGDPRLGESWRQFLVELADTDVARSQTAWKHRDPMVGVVLGRVFSSIIPQLPPSLSPGERY